MNRPAPGRPDENDPDGEKPRPLFSAAFWIAMAVSLGAVIAGFAVALLGPRL